MGQQHHRDTDIPKTGREKSPPMGMVYSDHTISVEDKNALSKENQRFIDKQWIILTLLQVERQYCADRTAAVEKLEGCI